MVERAILPDTNVFLSDIFPVRFSAKQGKYEDAKGSMENLSKHEDILMANSITYELTKESEEEAESFFEENPGLGIRYLNWGLVRDRAHSDVNFRDKPYNRVFGSIVHYTLENLENDFPDVSVIPPNAEELYNSERYDFVYEEIAQIIQGYRNAIAKMRQEEKNSFGMKSLMPDDGDFEYLKEALCVANSDLYQEVMILTMDRHFFFPRYAELIEGHGLNVKKPEEVLEEGDKSFVRE